VKLLSCKKSGGGCLHADINGPEGGGGGGGWGGGGGGGGGGLIQMVSHLRQRLDLSASLSLPEAVRAACAALGLPADGPLLPKAS